RHTRSNRYCSTDVCSSDLLLNTYYNREPNFTLVVNLLIFCRSVLSCKLTNSIRCIFIEEVGFIHIKPHSYFIACSMVITGIYNGYKFCSIYFLIKLNRSEEHTSELQSRFDLVCRILLEKKNTTMY